MSRYLFDTFCWIELFQGGPKTKEVKKLLEGGDSEILVSSITLPEIAAKFYAINRGNEVPHVLAAIVSKARVVEISTEIANAAGSFWAQHHAKTNLGLVDCILAATALANDATVVTGDSHFKLFKNARII